jgi:hypothetical protein
MKAGQLSGQNKKKDAPPPATMLAGGAPRSGGVLF